MSEHTKGPWVARDCGIYQNNPERIDVPVQIAATGDDDYNGIGAEQQRANAALIARAPDLLAERDRLAAVNAELCAALERIADEMQSASSADASVNVAWLDKRITVARAALQRAKEK